MLLRKLRSVVFTASSRKKSPFKCNNHHSKQGYNTNTKLQPLSYLAVGNTVSFYAAFLIFFKYSFLFCSICFLFFFFFLRTNFINTTIIRSANDDSTSTLSISHLCKDNVTVYVYELPPKFNQALLQDCRHLNIYTDMCPHVANRGLGQPLEQQGSNWFSTHQFIAEMIIHARMENHPCRTWEPQESTLFYVPFYGGLHASSKFRESDLVERDRLAMELTEYLSQQPWWQRKHGRDHFLALGRTAWDFMRAKGVPDFGANSLLNLPQVKNMSVLTVERHPWQGHNQYGIPYPSYFHPFTLEELLMWQQKMRQMERPHLFSFVGAPRVGVEKAAIRDEILQQCSESTRCHLLKCGKGASKCHSPKDVIEVMSRSEFCLQAPGDSFTRRSTFDSVLAGCIPVFFSPHTAYTQYGWYLPKDVNEYSVYMDEEKFKGEDQKMNIEQELLKIPREKVEKMQRTVIDLIPRLTYMHPNATTTLLQGKGETLFKWKDAVDIALLQLSKHVNY